MRDRVPCALHVWTVANTFALEDVPVKDKHYRKYAAGVDRALTLFDTALEEWADYISFLNRLLKVRNVV
jgi:protein dopey